MAKGRKTGGRQKGTPNKATADMRAAWEEAFGRVKVGDNNGGVDSLVQWGNENPTEFYKLAVRLVPQQIAGDPDRPLGLTIKIVRE